VTDPTTVTIADVRAALDRLGIDWDDVTELHMDPRCITVVRYARDTAGRIPVYAGEPVKRTTAIAIDRRIPPSDATAISPTPTTEET
jgi:hypothetical protein